MSADDTRPEPDAWQAAIDFGIDVTLLAANLERTPAQRLRELTAMNRLHPEAPLDAAALRAKFGDLLDYAAPDGKRSGPER